MLRSSEYPLLKKKPSDYNACDVLRLPSRWRPTTCARSPGTFEMINAETQLLYASDYPHWDFRRAEPDLGPAVSLREGEAQYSRR